MSRSFTALKIAFVAVLLALSACSKAAQEPADRLVAAARESSKPVVVDFGKGLCVQCIKQAEAMEEVGGQCGDRVGFEFVHVIEEAGLSGQYKVFMIPTIVFLDAAGEEVWRNVGLVDAPKLRAKLKEVGWADFEGID